MTYGWAALGFFLLAAAGGSAFAAVRALEAWRRLRALQRSITWGLIEVGGAIAAAEARAAALPDGLDDLARAQGRLGRSLSRARVIQTAAQDALSPLEQLRNAVPRKR